MATLFLLHYNYLSSYPAFLAGLSMLAVMRGGIIISETTFLLLMCIIECIV